MLAKIVSATLISDDGEMKRMALQAADIRLLTALQHHGKLSKSALAEIVNLLPTTGSGFDYVMTVSLKNMNDFQWLMGIFLAAEIGALRILSPVKSNHDSQIFPHCWATKPTDKALIIA